MSIIEEGCITTGGGYIQKYPDYKSIYSTFSGCDLIVIMDGKIAKGLSGLSYDKPLKLAKEEKPVKIKCTFVILGQDDPMKDFINKEFDIIIQFTNEYGQNAYKKILGAEFEREIFEAGVDTLALEQTYILSARDVTPLKQGTAEGSHIE